MPNVQVALIDPMRQVHVNTTTWEPVAMDETRHRVCWSVWIVDETDEADEGGARPGQE